MRNLAKIGVLGHQLDVADGGDVDPGTGRLLSIAELQQALRLVRTGQLEPDSTAPATPKPPAHGFEPAETDQGMDAGDDDPYGWNPDDDSSDADQDEQDEMLGSANQRRGRRGRDEVPVPPKARRRGRGSRRAAHPATEAAGSATLRPRSRLAAVRVTRKILGLDRGPDPLAGPPAADPQSSDLPSSDTDEVEPAAALRRRTSAADDFQVATAPRGFAAVFWRWTARVLVVVLLAAGVNQLFIKPLRHPAATAAAVAVIDPAVAGQVAARYAADYLSYSPTRTGANLPALTADSVATASTSTQLFSGAGYVRTDLVQPGQILTVDAAHVLVTETVRIHLAIPPVGTAAPQVAASSPAGPPPGSAGDPGPVPAGWTDLGDRWITLTVPVQATPAGLRVSASGAVFSGEPPMVIAPIAGANPDSGTTAATQSVTSAFFTGYGVSDVSYLIPPGAPVTGLSGAATFVALANWTVQTAAAAGTGSSAPATPAAGIGTASVTWQLAGTGIQITQQYAASLSLTSGRWYTAALGPATTFTE